MGDQILSTETQQLISSFAKEMKSTLTEEQIKSQIKIALLENNVLISQTVEHSIEKIAESVDRKTNAFIDQLKDVSKVNGALDKRLETVESTVNGLWAKMISIGAACTALGGLVGFFVSQLH